MSRVLWSYLFFFQAEDGIRDRNVTGVQTCALPISCSFHSRWMRCGLRSSPPKRAAPSPVKSRSEERRVGKECRSRRSSDQYKQKDKRNKKTGNVADAALLDTRGATSRPDDEDVVGL